MRVPAELGGVNQRTPGLGATLPLIVLPESVPELCSLLTTLLRSGEPSLVRPLVDALGRLSASDLNEARLPDISPISPLLLPYISPVSPTSTRRACTPNLPDITLNLPLPLPLR